ncbi:MAG: DUF6112 family protein [Acidimicrobiales bacterium]
MKRDRRMVVNKTRAITATVVGVATTVLIQGTAGAIDISPNTSLPGTSLLQTAVGGLMTIVEYTLLAALLIAPLCWAWGSHTGNFNLSSRGRSAVVYILAAVVIVGSANALVNWALAANLGIA